METPKPTGPATSDPAPAPAKAPAKPVEEESSSFDIMEILFFGIGRYRYWIVVFALVGTAWGMMNGLSKPNKYQSKGKFWIRFGNREQVTPETVMGRTGGRNPFAFQTINDELHLLRVPRLHDEIVRNVGVERILERFDPRQHDGPNTPAWQRWLHDWQAEKFGTDDPKPDPTSPRAWETAKRIVAGSLMINAERDAKILNVIYTGPSPGLCQDVLKAAMEACQKIHNEVFASQVKEEFATEQRQLAELRARDAMREYEEHREECGFYNITEVKKNLQNRITGTRDQLTRQENRGPEIEKELETLRRKIDEEEPVTVQLKTPPPTPNPEWQVIFQQLQAKKSELFQARLKYEGKKLEDFEADLEPVIAKLEEELAKVPKLIEHTTPQKVTEPNEVWVHLNKEVAKLEREYDLLPLQIANLEIDLERQNDKLKRLIACEEPHQEYGETIRRAQAQARSYQKVENDAHSRALLNAHPDASNLVILQEPNYTPGKIAPDRNKSITFGAAVGAGLGLAFALLRQLIDSKLRFPKSIERTLGVKIIGVIPEEKKWRSAGNKLRKRFAS